MRSTRAAPPVWPFFRPRRSRREAAAAALGLVAYGTYDLTNLATLAAFTWQIAMLDMLWRTLGTAVTAALSAAAMSRLVEARAT